MAHQDLAFVAQVDIAGVALEERDAEDLLELADGVADRARRQVQLRAAARNDPVRPAASKARRKESGTFWSMG